jgi:hypothetical protein
MSESSSHRPLDVERSFFAARYTYPGLTFLMMVMLILSKEVLYVLSKVPSDNTGLLVAVFGVIYLLNAAPLGFLISQVWFAQDIWQLVYGDKNKVENDPRSALPDIAYIMEQFPRLRDMGCEEAKFFKDRYHYLSSMQNPDVRRLVRVMITDYIHNSQAAEDETTAYSKRRWDMLITMGCVETSIQIGTGLGLLTKLIIDLFVRELCLGLFDVVLLLGVPCLAIFAIHYIDRARVKVSQEHALFTLLIIQDRTRTALEGGHNIQSLIDSLIGASKP